MSFGDFLEVFFWSRDFVWFCYSHVISLNFHARPFIYRFYVIYARKASLKPCARKKIRNSGNLQGLFVVRIGLSYIFLGSVRSVKAVIAHIFQPGARTWSVSITLRRGSWHVYAYADFVSGAHFKNGRGKAPTCNTIFYGKDQL